jgi:hypothetical protein
VRSIETGLPISGIVVELVRDEPGHTGLDAVTVAEIARTDAQGAFGPSPPLVIEPEDYRYALRLKDSERKRATSRTPRPPSSRSWRRTSASTTWS